MATSLLIVHGYSDGSTSFTALGDFFVSQGLYASDQVFYLDYSSMDDEAPSVTSPTSSTPTTAPALPARESTWRATAPARSWCAPGSPCTRRAAGAAA